MTEPSRDRPIPLYYQLKTLLLEEIIGGAYGTEGRLPTEHELCVRLGVSRTPVTRALSELAAEGVVLRRRRHGTFVNPHWLARRTDTPELRVLVPMDGPWADHLRSLARPDMRLSLVAVDLNELHSVFVHAVAEARGPDLTVLDSVWVAEFAASGFLYPLEDLDPDWVGGEYGRDFLQPFVDAHRPAGSTVAVQAEMDVGGLWYNRADLKNVGAEPPETWEDLREAGRRLVAAGIRRHALVIPAGPEADEYATYGLVTLLASNGVRVLSPGAVTLASPASVEAMNLLRSLADDGILPESVVSYPRDRTIQMLANGEASLSFGGSYEAPWLARGAGLPEDDITERFGFVPMPAGPRGHPSVLVGGMVYGIPRQAHRPRLAMELLKEAVTAGALARMCARTGHIPPRRSAVEMLAPHSAFHAHTAGLLDGAVVRPVTPVYTLVSAQIRSMLDAVLTRRLTPRAAVWRAADMISAITGLPVEHASGARSPLFSVGPGHFVTQRILLP
ncbi:MAG TPA: extracellular solute-binding protein [Streptosporangiaceae bacterium]|nr:extracellular solute-binding protein [Streptosporangiaceae bacterium]